MLSELKKLIRHELVHKEQHKRKKVKTHPPSPMDGMKEYLSSPDEIMAFARSAADGLIEIHNGDKEKIVKDLRKASEKKFVSSSDIDLYQRYFSPTDKVFKKFIKNIYLYLEKDGVIN